MNKHTNKREGDSFNALVRVRTFAERTKLTGQLCFDFIRDGETEVCYPIECNPRVHSQCAVFLEDDKLEFGDAVLAEHFPKTLCPSTTAPPVFWLYNEVNKQTNTLMLFCLRADFWYFQGHLIF